MKIYNTLRRKKEEFKSIKPNEVKMYVCGPTVYDYIHIGNARPLVVFDTIRRYFQYKNYKVTYVQNFTDIDDKIINRANEEDITAKQVSERFIQETILDCKGLNILETINPCVTNEIDSIIEMIEELIHKKVAYEINGSVYFDAKNYNNYGKLSRKNIDDLISGSRVAINTEKKSPIDFILWKPAKENEPFWESPWGNGRPGWHIECSVMSKKYLGETIDIHGGGEDLVFPHHENEIAQSESLSNKPMANYWIHNGFINVDNEKMSKSKGNFFTLRDIVKEYSYEEVRFFILSCHYRSPLNFSEELMQSSGNGLNRIKTAIENMEFLKDRTKGSITVDEAVLLKDSEIYKDNFDKSMDDDFNTADAITAIYELIKFSNIHLNEHSSNGFIEAILKKTINLLGILGLYFPKESNLENEIENLITEREVARKNKDWATADKIRDELDAKGIILKDTSAGVKWSKK
ncbi:MAG: cysteine--tRNA ligase [Lachnospirales bacterium]